MPPSRKRPGKSLETLVSSLERALGGKGNISVESPAFLPDRVTGNPREHDVVITLTGSHHKTVIAIECRDRSRKITSNDVEGFWAKCQDTGIDQGIIVSPKGFAKPALTKAGHRNIRCLQLSEVDSFNWLLTAGMMSFQHVVHHIDWKFIPSENLITPPTDFTLMNADGIPVDSKNLEPVAMKEFQQIQVDEEDRLLGEVSIHFPSVDLLLRDNSTGSVHKLQAAVAVIHFSVVEGFAPFQKFTYTNSPSGEVITDAAIAEVDVGGFRGKLMIVHHPDKGGKILFVPEKPDKP